MVRAPDYVEKLFLLRRFTMTTERTSFILSAVMVACTAAAAPAQTPLGTALTYQGQLKQSGTPLDDTADFEFSLFNAPSGGVQIGSTNTLTNVDVVDGLFTVTLDFGTDAFNGDARFLEIAVRSPAGGGAFTTLTTRQKLTGAPYALKVPGIDGFSLDAADGSPTDALFVDDAGKVGIGTVTPDMPLQIRHEEPVLILQDSGSNSTQSGYLGFWNSNPSETAWVGFGTPGSPHFSVVNARSGGNIALLPASGNVGIGTTTPVAKLDVRGGAMLVENLGDQADLLWLASERSWVFRQEGTGAVTALKLESIGGGGNKNFIIQTTGFVGIGTSSPQAKLHVNGTTRTSILEITGADLAEKFPASEKLEPGMVVAIDSANPGKICLSRGAYNRCVAGIVSGANDFAVGAVLGSTPDSEDAPAVALSGRVYVQCDATSVPIEPGDLLTTADVPGHAMKVTDFPRAQGAIIGKAMTALAHGESGMVLVLVSLQ
jgi:hypothetical protein